jgi:hypothetical protein
MADKKISQLTAASTPLAGTEVLPIVQSGSTVKVASDDLTVKNVRSNATTGILQIAGPAAASTRIMTVPNANFTAARTDAAQTFTGTQTFSADASVNGVLIGRGNSSLSANVRVGAGALAAVTTGNDNTAVGNNALNKNTTGTLNTAVGGSCLDANTNGSQNSALGFFAGLAITSGAENTAIGSGALRFATTANNNTAVGAGALYSATGDNNVGLGRYAGLDISTGTLNTALGQGAAQSLTTGSRNTIVGSSSNASAVGGNDQTVVGNGLTGKGNDTAFIGGTNGAYNEKNVTTWETTSDERIKKNIADNYDGLGIIKQIRVRNFEYRKPEEIAELPAHAAIDKGGVQLGVIAQEIRKVLPHCVSENSTGVLSVNTDPLVWHLVNAVKQLSAQVEELKAKIKD